MLNRSEVLLSAVRGHGNLRQVFACTRQWATLDDWRARGLESRTAGESLPAEDGQTAGAPPRWKNPKVNGTLAAREWVFCS